MRPHRPQHLISHLCHLPRLPRPLSLPRHQQHLQEPRIQLLHLHINRPSRLTRHKGFLLVKPSSAKNSTNFWGFWTSGLLEHFSTTSGASGSTSGSTRSPEVLQKSRSPRNLLNFLLMQMNGTLTEFRVSTVDLQKRSKMKQSARWWPYIPNEKQTPLSASDFVILLDFWATSGASESAFGSTKSPKVLQKSEIKWRMFIRRHSESTNGHMKLAIN